MGVQKREGGLEEELKKFNDYLKNNTFLKIRSRQLYSFIIRKFLKQTRIHELIKDYSPPKIDEYQSIIIKGIITLLKKKNEDYLLPALKHYFQWKKCPELVSRIPKIPRSQKKRTPPTLNNDLLNKLEGVFPHKKWSRLYETIYYLQKITGARASMIIKLSVNDIKLFDDYAVLLMRGKAVRSDKIIKAIIYDSKTLKLLKDYLNDYILDWSYPFTKKPKKPKEFYKIVYYTYIYYWRFLHLMSEKAKINLSTHDLRRYFIYSFYELSGHDLQATRKIIGHSSIQTTAIYLESYTPNLAKTARLVQQKISGDKK